MNVNLKETTKFALNNETDEKLGIFRGKHTCLLILIRYICTVKHIQVIKQNSKVKAHILQ